MILSGEELQNSDVVAQKRLTLEQSNDNLEHLLVILWYFWMTPTLRALHDVDKTDGHKSLNGLVKHIQRESHDVTTPMHQTFLRPQKKKKPALGCLEPLATSLA